MSLFPSSGVALISGGAQGIGLAVARALLREGCRVAIVDIDGERIANAKNTMEPEGRCEGYVADITNREECVRTAAAVKADLGTISAVVNCAGTSYRGGLDSSDFGEGMQRVLDVNLLGTLNVTRACLDQLKETQGAVVNVASAAALVAGTGGIAYTASKGAIVSITRALARDCGLHGVRVNAVAPSTTETPMTQSLFTDEERIEKVRSRTLLKRMAKPEDIAGPIVFLASSLACYVTGVTLPVDAGFTAA